MAATLNELGITAPVLAAPMAGGPGAAAMAIAAGRAGSLGFVAGGYKSAAALRDEIAEVRAAGVPFAVNLFAPNPVPVDPGAFRAYAERIRPEAEALGVELGDGPVEDDDAWAEKLELLVREPVAILSFTFGIPHHEAINMLRRAGTGTMIQTVSSPEEAELAAGAGIDALIVQSAAAGGHWGTLTPASPPPGLPLDELVSAVRARVALPLIAAGGIATREQVGSVLRAGAEAAMVGTVLLRSPESGAAPAHQAALVDPARSRAGLTRSFTGRPAGALGNGFLERHEAAAPLGYPALHHLTRPIRRAAADAGDPERLHLWAGAGHRHAVAEPAAAILARLAP